MLSDTEKERTTKRCSKCGVEKSVLEFHAHKHGLLGKSSTCKACDKARAYAWRVANPGGHARLQHAYRSRHPDRAKASLAKWMDKHPEYMRKRSAHRWKTDPIYRDRIKAWGKAHPKLMLAYGREHEHRKRLNGGRGLTVQQIEEILSKPCAYCGKLATDLDHVMPLSRGGPHDIDNIAPSCHSCNSSKNARTPEEWMAARAV